MTRNSIQSKILFSILFTTLMSGCSATKPAPVSSLNALDNLNKPNYDLLQRGSYNGSFYEVQKGDTLYFIAYITNQDVNDLIRANKLQPPHIIHPGQKLKIWGEKYIPPAYGEKGTLVSIENEANTPISSDKVIVTPIETAPPPSADIQPETPVVSKVTAPQIPVATPEIPPVATPVVAPIPIPISPKPEKKELIAKNIEKTSQNVSQKKSGTVSQNLKEVEQKKSKEYSQNVAATKPSTNPNKSKPKNGKLIWKWPTEGRLISGFSSAEMGNKGLDIAGKQGQHVIASADGKVVYAGNALRGYGNLIIIKHNDDFLSAYAHNDHLFVSERQSVKQGQKIASMGSSGTTSVRLHFEIRYKGKSVNPLRYLPKR